MPFSVSRRSWAGALALLSVASAALAHEYVIEREGGAYVLYQGHKHAAHAGDERVPYDPAIVQKSYCVRTGDEIVRVPPASVYPLRINGPCAAVFIQASSGYWSQTLTGTQNKPKTEASAALRSWLSEESIKLIEAWTPILTAPLTQGLELVPLGDPRTIAVGGKLRLRALWRGKPKAGVTVAYQGDPRGVTGDDGTVNIRLRRSGTQVISASFEEPLNDPKADKIVRATILQFQTR